ncbi:MAG: HAD-IA family hydrolase [Caulobacteraceae bacterium]
MFDLGGVLLPFDRERRVRAVAERLGIEAASARALFAGDLPGRMDLGLADEGDFARAFSVLGGRAVERDEARSLTLSAFEAPNRELWALARAARRALQVAAFTDNPVFVREVFPDQDVLAPVVFSSEIGAVKPSDEAFAAMEARLGVAPGAIVFVDDSGANVEAAHRRGWDAILYRDNAAVVAELAKRGIP